MNFKSGNKVFTVLGVLIILVVSYSIYVFSIDTTDYSPNDVVVNKGSKTIGPVLNNKNATSTDETPSVKNDSKADTKTGIVSRVKARVIPDNDEDRVDEQPLGIDGVCGFYIDNLIEGQEVSFPLDISGTISVDGVEDNCEWFMIDTSSGNIDVFYKNINEDEREEWILLQDNFNITATLATSTQYAFTSQIDLDIDPLILTDNEVDLKFVFKDFDSAKRNVIQNKFETEFVYNANLSTPLSCGFRVTSVAPDDIVNFPAIIEGDIDNSDLTDGCSWNTFEGNGGISELYYLSGEEWFKLGSSTPIVVDDTNATSSAFKTELDFVNDGVGLPLGTELKVVFTEYIKEDENPLNVVNFELPIVLGKQELKK